MGQKHTVKEEFINRMETFDTRPKTDLQVTNRTDSVRHRIGLHHTNVSP